MYAFSRYVRGISQLRSVEHSEVGCFPVDSYLGRPLGPVFIRPEVARRRIRHCVAHVLAILLGGNISKIFNSVIAPAPVNVINPLCRPYPIHIHPSESVSKVTCTINANFDIPVACVRVIKDCAGFGSVAGWSNPCKESRALVVAKHLFKTLLCQRRIDSAHVACSLKTMMWEVTPRACKPWALRHFTPGFSYGT